MNNIKTILNINKSKQVLQTSEYEKAKVVFNNLLNAITKHNIISYNIDEVLDFVFELRFKEGTTKQELLSNDIKNFNIYFNGIKDIDETFVYKEMIDFYNSQKIFLDFNDYITKEKKSKYIENLFENLYKEIKYIEEFEIIKNRINYFFNCDVFFKVKENLISFNNDKEKELMEEVESFFLDQKKFFKFLKKEKVKEINTLHNVYNKEEIDEKEKKFFEKIQELEDKIKNANGVD